MIGGLIASVALLGVWGHSDKVTIKTVPFTFEATMSPDSPLIGTKNTLFVSGWPHVVAIDASSGKRLWETNLTSYAALHHLTLGAFPIEVGGSVAFCFTYVKSDGTIETEIESRRRKDGALNFIVHVETPPVPAGRIVYSSAARPFVSVRPFYVMTWPNVAAVGNLLLVVPDPALNPELFVLSAATGAVKAKIRPGEENPSSLPEPLIHANPICFGACVYARGKLISLADSPYGPPSRLVYLGDRILAQYSGEFFLGAPSLTGRQGLALFPWSPTQHRKIEDLWHGAFMAKEHPGDDLPTYDPCLGQQEGNPMIFCRDWKGNSSIVKIDDKGNVIRVAPLDTWDVWRITVGDSGVFLLYGEVVNDVFDLNGTKLLSLRTRRRIPGDAVYLHTTLLPCGVAWTNYSRVGTSDKFKFVGGVVSFRNRERVR